MVASRMIVRCACGVAVLVCGGCERAAPDAGSELPPHVEIGTVAAPAPSAPVKPAPNVPEASWPRKMPIDPMTGYLTTPAPKVRHAPRIIAWFPIGNSDTAESTRRISWDIPQKGWPNFIEKWVEPSIGLGFDAIQLHNPGGTRAGEEMQADQFVTAQESGMDWISRGFVESWRPVTHRIPVIAYIGMLPKNQRFQGLLDRGDQAGFLKAITDSYRLPLNAKMEIAFDALHDVDEHGWPLQVYRLFTSMGVRTYVETAPNVHDAALYDANFEIILSTLERTLRNGEGWMADPGKMSGERIVLLPDVPAGKDPKAVETWLGLWIHHWTSQGWSVGISPIWCVEHHRRPWEMEQEAARKLGRPSTMPHR